MTERDKEMVMRRNVLKDIKDKERRGARRTAEAIKYFVPYVRTPLDLYEDGMQGRYQGWYH